MVNAVKLVSSFGKILKNNGLQIKSIEQTILKNAQGADYLVKLKNGSTGIYAFSRENGRLQQTLRTGDKVIFSDKIRMEGVTDVFSKAKGEYVNIPKTVTKNYVKDLDKISYASVFKRTPVGTKAYKDNGIIKNKVFSTQEFHESKYLNKICMPKDILIGTDGLRYPIFQRPMNGVESGLDVWKKYS